MTSRTAETSTRTGALHAVRGRWESRLLRMVAFGASSIALSVAIATVPAAVPAAAEPPVTVADAKAQIEQLETDAAAIDQDSAGVQQQIDQGRAKLEQKQADVKAEAARVARLKKQVGHVALAQFQNRDLDTAAQLIVNDDTEGFLSQISTVQKVSENQNSVLQDYQQEQASLADLEHSSATDLAVLQQQQQRLQALRAKSDGKIAEAKAVLARLNEQQRKAIAAAEKKQAEEAKAAAERAAGNTQPASKATSSTSRSSAPSAQKHRVSTSAKTNSSATITSGLSSKGAGALAFARAQLGKPYRYGATGPGAYDCSGLTLAAWRSVGVSLPRTSQEQFGVGRPVAQSDLQPGDLVFFYGSSPSHVGLYAGNGIVLHAPNSRASVQYIKMSYMPFSGARRPG